MSCVIFPSGPIGVTLVSPVARDETSDRKNDSSTASTPYTGEMPKYAHASAMVPTADAVPPTRNHFSGTSTSFVRGSSPVPVAPR